MAKWYPDALVEHPARQFVWHLEVEGSREDSLGLDEVEEALQLGGDPVVGVQDDQHGVPEISGGIRGVGHGFSRLGAGRAVGDSP
jgi:hypothetical protein